jgi:2-octaprenyl-6-methoxyphenol hydroxylase
MVWCVTSADDPVAGLTDAQRIAVLNTLLPAAAGTVVGLSPLKQFPLGLNAERTLTDGAIVRIGNAAQTLHPVAGQGLNLGLRDAAALVQALRNTSPADLPAVLRRLEWQRGPDRWSMIAATDFLARSFTWRWPGLPAARGLGLALLQRLPPVKSALARQMMFGRR